MIPQGKELYIALAKTNPYNKAWVRHCFRNYVRVKKKEDAQTSSEADKK